MPAYRGPDGKIVYVSDDDASRMEAGGYERVGDTAAGQAQSRIAPVDNGILGSIGATVSAGLSGATLGGTDWLLKGVLNKGQFEQLAQDRGDNPVLSGVAQMAGATLPALVSGGSITPSGYLSHLAGEGIAAGQEAGGALGAVRQLTAAGAEGALQNAGAYLSDVALGDRDLTAEGVTGALGTGFAFGSGGLVAMHGIQAGTMAARRMFARYAQGGEQAAKDAAAAWQAESAKSFEAFDQAEQAAKGKLQEAQLAREQADLARKQAASSLADARAGVLPTEPGAPAATAGADLPALTSDQEIAGMLRDRAVAAGQPDRLAAWDAANGAKLQEAMAARGGAPPTPSPAAAPEMGLNTTVRGLGDLSSSVRVPPVTADEAELAAKLSEYQDARRAFDAVHASVDPDLDAALKNIGEINPQREPVPTGEFGAPGARGIKSPEELAKLAAGEREEPRFAGGTPKGIGEAAAERAPIDVTAVGKRKPGGSELVEQATNVGKRPAGVDSVAPQITSVGKRPAEVAVPEPAKPLSDDEFKAFKKEWGHAGDDSYAAEMHYSKGGDEIVNPELRSGKPLSANAQKLYDGLMSAYRLPESRLPRDVELYRGISDKSGTAVRDRFANVKPGDILEDPAFTSTTYTGNAGSRGEQVTFSIHAPKGTPVLPIRSHYSNEGELLLPPGSKFRVLSVDTIPVSERWPLKGSKSVEEFRRDMGDWVVNEDKSTTFTDRRGRTFTHDPIKEIRVELVDAPAPHVAIARPAPVGLDAPIEQLSKRQLLQYKSALSEAFDKATEGSPEYRALLEKDDVATRRLNDLSDGVIAPPEREFGDTGPGRASVGPATPARAAGPIDKTGSPSEIFARNNATPKFEDGRNEVELRVSSANGDGRIRMVRDKDGQFRLSHITVDGRLRGRGLGAAMYLEMADHLEQKYGQKLMSDFARSDDAERVWRGFEKRGLARPIMEPGASAGDRPIYWILEPKAAQSADSDLLSALQGTKSKLDSGESLSAMGKPARAEYRTAKAAKTAAAKEHFRAKATAASETAPAVAAEPETELERLLRGTKGALDGGRGMREIGGASAMNEAVGAKPAADMGTPQSTRVGRRPELPETPAVTTPARAPAEYPLATKNLEMQLDEALDRVKNAPDEAARAAAEHEVAVISDQMTHIGARPGAVEDVAAMAPALHRVEKAAAELTEALGDAAPAAAKEHAAAFRQAEDTADAKSMARTARAADDHAAAQDKAQAEDFLGPSKKDRAVAAAKQRKLEAESAYAKSRVAEAEASIAARKATAAAKGARAAAPTLAPPTAQGTGVGKRLVAGAHAVGYAAELGSDLGIPGIPRPHDIPVIGPLLSAYLKYRALRAAAGRFVGRIPATADAQAAALAARTRDGIARSVDRSLGLIERNGGTIRRVVTIGAIRANEALSRRAFDDGQPDAPAKASIQEQAAVRMREVSAVAANPQLIADKVRQETRGVMDPDLITALQNHLMLMFSHLAEVAPKLPPPNPYSKRQAVPSAADALRFGQRLAVANDPQVAFEMLEAGALTPAAAETMRAVYQNLFREAQARIVERANDLKNPVPYRQLLQNGLLFDVPLHDSLDPENASVLATAHRPIAPAVAPQAPPPPPPPSTAAPTNLTKLYASGMDRSAGRM